MRVRDLPQWLQQIAEQRTIQDKGYFTMESTISSLFMFDRTPEGWQYWSDIAKGIIPPQPMEHKIDILQDRVWAIGIHNFKYNKDINTFTIKYNKLSRVVNILPQDKIIPDKIYIQNPKTGVIKTFYIDVLIKDNAVYVGPQSTKLIRYYHVDSLSSKPYYLDVIVDVHDLEQPVLHGKTKC